MKISTNCKFCKIPISVEVDDSYADLCDQYKIIPMASCNRCSDIRVNRRSIEAAINIACNLYRLAHHREKVKDDTRKALTTLTQRYARLIAKWFHLDGMCWEPAIVESVLEEPRDVYSILKRMWKMTADYKKRRELEESPTNR